MTHTGMCVCLSMHVRVSTFERVSERAVDGALVPSILQMSHSQSLHVCAFVANHTSLLIVLQHFTKLNLKTMLKQIKQNASVNEKWLEKLSCERKC